MKNTGIIVIAFLALVTTSCKRELKPTFQTVENVYFVKGEGVITAHGEVVMNNPNPVDITITAADLLLSLNQKELGTMTVEEPFVAEAKKDFIIPIELTFEPDKILSNMFSTGGLGRMMRTQKADFIVDGTVTVKVVKKDFSVPVSSKTEVDLRPRF